MDRPACIPCTDHLYRTMASSIPARIVCTYQPEPHLSTSQPGQYLAAADGVLVIRLWGPGNGSCGSCGLNFMCCLMTVLAT
jgi:hypothetical protein